MTTLSIVPRPVKIATATAFSAGALAIVLQDIIDLRNPLAMWNSWTLAHSLAVLAIAGVTMAADLAWDAFRAKRPVVGAGFLAVTVVGLGLVVFNSVGRQAEAHSVSTLAAESHNDKIEAAKARLAKAESDKKEIDDKAIETSAEKNCARNCKELLIEAQKNAQAEVEAARDALNAIGPPMAVATKAKQWGKILELFGVPPERTEQFADRLEYVFWTLLFELGAMVSWCFVFDHRAVAKVGNRASATEIASVADADLVALRAQFEQPVELLGNPDTDPEPTPPGNRSNRKGNRKSAKLLTFPATGRSPSNRRANTVSELAGLAWLRNYTHRHGILPSQDVMATELDVHKGTVAKWMDRWEAEGLIVREQAGRCKTVRMA